MESSPQVSSPWDENGLTPGSWVRGYDILLKQLSWAPELCLQLYLVVYTA